MPRFHAPPSPRQNRLLAALPPAQYQRLRPHLQWVMMPLGSVVHESGGAQEHVVFPATSIVCNLCVTADGCSAESAVVGNEGVTGLALFMGGGSMPGRSVVYSAGYGYRVGSRVLQMEFGRDPNLQHLLLRYTQALMTQLQQTAVCNRHHAVQQQLCSLLLSTLDRTVSGQLTLSHELIADMLGVRRETVTVAAGRLKSAGLIRYARGHITMAVRRGIEALACECYAVVKREYDRLLPAVAARAPWPATEYAAA